MPAKRTKDYGMDQLRGHNDKEEEEYTVEEAIDFIGIGRFQIIALFILIIGWTSDSMEILVLSVLEPELLCAWNLSVVQTSMLSFLTFLGMTFQSSLWGILSDKFGRLFQLKLAAVLMLVFGILCSAVPTFVWLVIIRFFVGGLIAGFHQSIPIVPEFVPRNRRGTFVWLLNLSFAIGGGFAVGIAWLVMPSWGWRAYLAICTLPSLIFLILCQWLPESPHFYMSSGRPEKAMEVLRHIAKMNGKPLPPGKLKKNHVSERRGEYVELVSTPFLKKMTILLPALWFITSFVLYGVVFLSSTLLKSENPCSSCVISDFECHDECSRMTSEAYLSLFIVSLADMPGVVFASLTIDVYGRKFLLCGGAILSALASASLMTCWENRIFTTVCIFISRGAIDVTFITLFVYTPEVYPTRVRALSVGVCNGCARLGAALTPLVAQILSRYTPQLSLLIYAICSTFCFIGCLFLPETKGKPIPT
ncbi:synaptic vesicle 2-related protein-like [Apostichopus japonicus]|uniref:synaptic vesicle 2-related protein-like n=1 Tax=Stichopus japonicus TaxID=307972 RepID=UPI003AB8EAAA